MFIDTHAHLFYPDYNGEQDSILENAANANVDYILIPGTDLASSAKASQLAEKYPQIYASVGVHPHDSAEWDKKYLTDLEYLIQNNKKVCAVGEIGLDYYYDFSPKEKQHQAFRDQIEFALKHDLPVIVHNRDADEDVLRIVSEYCASGLRAQFHCFSSSVQMARELVKMGQFISFTGNITFKKMQELREVASMVPVEHLLLETDSPFMTPEPKRGKRNEPSNVRLVAEKLAELHHLTVDDIARVTSYNAFQLFGIGAPPEVRVTYKIGRSLYINVTNRCNADCTFCQRKDAPFIVGYNLKMAKKDEPTPEEYIRQIGDPKQYSEIVFCGYGEPTIRWDVVKQVAECVKVHGGKTRMNTNGHGNVINKRDITPEMEGVIDTVSVSLNSPYPSQYAEIMRLDESYFHAMVEFTRKAKAFVPTVVLSIVTLDEVEREAARKFAEEEVGVLFRERIYF